MVDDDAAGKKKISSLLSWMCKDTINSIMHLFFICSKVDEYVTILPTA